MDLYGAHRSFDIAQPFRIPAILLGALFFNVTLAAPPVVLEPSGPVDRVPAGLDFATQELGDPWDMDRMEDIFTPNSLELVNETIADGVYSFDTIETDLAGVSRAQFWLVHPGVLNSQLLVSEDRNPETGRRLFTRERFPIETGKYRYLTARVRMSSATAEPLVRNQHFVAYYFEDSTSIGNALYGNSTAFRVPPNEWTIVRIDLATEVDPGAPESWSLLPQVEGLRIDPTSNPGVHVEIDWIRLTSEPLPAEFIAVAWDANDSPEYTVFARPAGTVGGTPHELASGVVGTRVEVALSELPPGDYHIEVAGNGESGSAPGLVAINEVPLIRFLSPNIKGDQSLGYGAVVNSNPWSEIDAGDVAAVLGFESWSFSNPTGSLSGRPETDRSRVLMKTPVPIDTAFYRMLCFELEIAGPRDIGAGSVTKILWGNFRSKLTTPSPVIAQEGLNEYCVGDMAELQIDPFSPEGAEDAWVGPISYIRFDPHEFPRTEECNDDPSPSNCRDIRFDSMILAPFHRANPDFNFHWEDSDRDDDAQFEIWLDDDRIPGNTPGSKEYLVAAGNEDTSTGNLVWLPPGDIPPGTWNIYGIIDDSLNSSVRYASGPLLIGQPPRVAVTVNEPDGSSDEVISGPEYGLHERNDQWDMDDSELNLSRNLFIDGLTLANGILSGTASTNNPQFTLMTTDEGDPVIDSHKYRYLTVKIRATEVAGPHFVQVFYSADAKAPPASRGLTSGLPIFENDWSFITFDLHSDVDPTSPVRWADLTEVRYIRLDPTTKPGTHFEIDWITLSAEPTPATNYQILWTAAHTGTSTFDVNLIDALGHRQSIATGLPPETRSLTTNLGALIVGRYYTEVIARPGPAAVSSGAINLVPISTSIGVLFKDGFE